MSTTTTRAARGRFLALLASSAMIAAGMLGVAVASPASAAAGLGNPNNPNSPGQSGEHKITICHRTNSTTNPYVTITVDQDAADGDAGNDKGQGDHYKEHLGPVWNSSMPNGGDWGDIIPPIADVHGGRNWDAAGQAIYNNGCNVPTFTATKTAGGTAAYCLNGADGSYTYFGSGKATSNISQADADKQAQDAADAAALADKTKKLPSGATAGACTVYTSTQKTTGSADYCAADGTTNGSYEYSGTGTATSKLSQTDADGKAQALADTNAAADKTAKLPQGATPGACGDPKPFTSTKTAGGEVTYCLSGAEGSIDYFGSGSATSTVSQTEADELAQKAADDAAAADKKAKLPTGAKEGTCEVFTGTAKSGGSVAYCLNDTAGSYTYSGEATVTSTVSQDDADAQAQKAADAKASEDRVAKLPAGATVGSCTPKTPEEPKKPETPVTPSTPETPVTPVVEEATVTAVEPATVEAPQSVTVPMEATVAPTPQKVAVPAAATLPAAVPAGGGSTAPGIPTWAIALIVLGALGAATAGITALKR